MHMQLDELKHIWMEKDIFFYGKNTYGVYKWLVQDVVCVFFNEHLRAWRLFSLVEEWKLVGCRHEINETVLAGAAWSSRRSTAQLSCERSFSGALQRRRQRYSQWAHFNDPGMPLMLGAWPSKYVEQMNKGSEEIY